jgi:signal transduction histidine kinase
MAGLTLAARIVESQEGAGATVSIRLPVAPSSALEHRSV